MPKIKPNQRPAKHVICIERVAYLSELYWEMYVQEYRNGDYMNPVVIDDYVCDDIKELQTTLKKYLEGVEYNEGSVNWL